MLFDHLMALPDLSRVGSILAMLVFISVLIIAHELGHFFVARRCGVRVERFGFGLPFGPTLWSRRIGDVEYCIHACLFGGYVSFPDDDPENPLPPDSPERFENKSLRARFAVMVAGVTVNAILGWLILFSVFMIWGHPTGEAEKKVLIGDVLSASAPAAVSGLRKGDEIRKLAGQPLQGRDYLEMVKQVRDTMKENRNRPMTIQILRQGRLLDLPIKPDAEGKVGIQLAAMARYAPVDGAVDGALKTTGFLTDVIGKQFTSLGMLLTGQTNLQELAGPIRIVNEGSKMIDQNGVQTGLILTAIISTVLAVMNLLPIPALDGGHILFLLIEAVKGSPVRQEFRERVTQYGFLGLLALIGFILLNDINNTFFAIPK